MGNDKDSDAARLRQYMTELLEKGFERLCAQLAPPDAAELQRQMTELLETWFERLGAQLAPPDAAELRQQVTERLEAWFERLGAQLAPPDAAELRQHTTERLEAWFERLGAQFAPTQAAQLWRQVTELNHRVRQLAEMVTVENVMVNGFERLSAQLEPLRELGPSRRQLLNEDQRTRLQNLRDSLKRPKWSSAGLLPTKDTERVPFIGAEVPRVPAHGQPWPSRAAFNK